MVTCDLLGTPAAAPCMHNVACLQWLNGSTMVEMLSLNRVSIVSHAEHQLH